MTKRVLLVVAILGLLLVFAPGCKKRGSGSSSGPHKRPDFEKMVLGANLDEVRAKLGAPDAIELPAVVRRNNPYQEGYWMYKGVSINPTTGEKDKTAELWIEQKRVVRITYNGGS